MTLLGDSLQARISVLAAYLAVAVPWVAPLPSGPSAIVGATLLAAMGLSVLCLVRVTKYGSDPAASGLVWAAVLSVIVVLVQFAASSLSQPYAPARAVSGGATTRIATIISSITGQMSGSGPAYGNLRQPNLFATLMAIGWIACVALMRTGALRSRAFGYGVIALLAVGNAASGSRTGLLLWVLVGAALWGWSRSNSQQSLAQRSQAASSAEADASSIRSAFTPVGMTTWAWGTYVFALVLLPQLVDSDRHLLHRLTSGAPDCQSRLVLWSNMLHLIAQKPWFGWGWGELDYAHYITAYPGMRFCGLLDNAHNLPLHLAVELGMPVAVLFCAGVVRFVWRRKPWRERDPMRFGAWLILGAIGVHSLLEYPLWYGPFQMTALLCVWMVWRHPEGKGAAGTTQLGRRLMQAAALALSAAAFYAAWDYHRISQLYLPAGQRSAWYAADPWTYARRSWLFADHVRFAELVTTPLTQDNAAHMAQLAEKMLHFSPEPAVVRTLIESLRLLGRDTEAGFHAQRLKDAYAGRDE